MASRATPTSSASVNERAESGMRGVASGSKLQGFDISPNPPMASSYELGKFFLKKREPFFLPFIKVVFEHGTFKSSSF